jgi:hypothetical protein
METVVSTKKSGKVLYHVLGVNGKPRPIFHESELGREKRLEYARAGLLDDHAQAPEVWRFLQSQGSRFGVWSPAPVLDHNIYTNAGMAADAWRTIQDDEDSAAVGRFRFVASGTGSTAEDAAQTSLGTEITTGGLARAAGATIDTTTTAVTGDTSRVIITWNITGSFTITEYGWFNAASGGTMRARSVQTGLPVVSGETLNFTWLGRNSA